MKTRVFLTIASLLLVLSSCTGSRIAGSANEVDDVYYTSADRKAEQEVAKKSRADQEAYRRASEVDVPEEAVATSEPATSTGRYDRNLAEKNGEFDEYYGDDPAPYSDDDYYYSRQVRRFNSRSWNYYDPYYSYDPYYAIGTPTWGNAYVNSPWWYDPYFYNGPSYAWTYGGFGPAYGTYGSLYGWNRPWYQGSGWSVSIGSGFGYGYGGGWNNNGFGGGFNNFGYGGYNNFGYGGYGGYGNAGYYNGYNPYCGPGYGGGGYYGNNTGGFGNGSAANNGQTGPRTNPSSLNTSGRPGNQPINPRSVRPYQGDYPVVITPTQGRPVGKPNPVSQPGNANTGRANTVNDRPVYNKPTTSGTSSRPTKNTYSTPRSNGTQSRPTKNTYSTPRSNGTQSRPTQNYSTPRSNGTQSRPSRSTSRPKSSSSQSRPSGRSTYSKPSRSSSSRPSYSSPSRSSSRPSYSAPSRSSSSGSSRSSGGSSKSGSTSGKRR